MPNEEKKVLACGVGITDDTYDSQNSAGKIFSWDYLASE